MAKKKTTTVKKDVHISNSGCSCTTSACNSNCCGYILAAIGAAVYYISTATSFWGGVWGLIKALLWPAFLVYELLVMTGMQ